jgi:hypothetical protein
MAMRKEAMSHPSQETDRPHDTQHARQRIRALRRKIGWAKSSVANRADHILAILQGDHRALIRVVTVS